MANRGETHVWFDGDAWYAYTERRADLARFTGWFGPPERRGRDGACAHWGPLPKDALRVRRKAQRALRALSELQRSAARERLAVARDAIGRRSIKTTVPTIPRETDK